MFKALLAAVLLTAAPVPKGPPPAPPPDPIQVGYEWNFSGHLLRVTAVDGDCVAYVCLNRPKQTWPGMDGFWETNRQSKQRTRNETEMYKGRELLPWEYDF